MIEAKTVFCLHELGTALSRSCFGKVGGNPHMTSLFGGDRCSWKRRSFLCSWWNIEAKDILIQKKKVQKNSFTSFDLKPQQIIQNSQSKAPLRGREGDWGDRKQEVGCITCLQGIGHSQVYIVWGNPHINLQIRGVDYTHFSAKDTKDL